MTWAEVGLHKGVTPRSCQGHLKVTAKSNQPKRVKIVSFCSYCSNSVHLRCLWVMTIETHLVGTPNTSQEVTWVIWRLESNTPPPRQNDLYVTPPPISYDRNGPNSIYSVMFRPITNTLLKVMKPNPSKHGETGWGKPLYGYYPKVKSRSSQGHIPGRISQKGWK